MGRLFKERLDEVLIEHLVALWDELGVLTDDPRDRCSSFWLIVFAHFLA